MNAIRNSATALALATACLAATAAGSLTLSPASPDVAAGTSFALEVDSSFTDSVIGGGFNLSYDAALLTLDSLAIDGVVWNDALTRSTGTAGPGSVQDVFFNALGFLAPGAHHVATLNFTAGNTAGVANVSLAESASFPFANSAAELVSMSYGSAAVTISAVPEPATVASLLAGLALLPWLRRRRG